MSIILDSCIFIDAERNNSAIPYEEWREYENTYISAITVSELLMGVHMANSSSRQMRRTAFVEAILSQIITLPFTQEVARVHAEIFSHLSKKGHMIGTHDLIIAATALSHGFALATKNSKEFKRVPGLKVLTY